MKKTPLLNTKLVQHMDVPMIPNVLMLDAGENLDDKLFVRGDLLDALSVDIYFKDAKSKLLTVFDVVTTKLRNHISDTYCHTNPAEKRYWNNKLDKATFDEAFSVLKARLDGWEGRLEDIERTIGNLPNFDTFALKTDIEGVYVSYDDLEDALESLNIPTQENPGDFVKQSDLEDYLKKGDVLGTINGQVFHQGDSISITADASGDTYITESDISYNPTVTASTPNSYVIGTLTFGDTTKTIYGKDATGGSGGGGDDGGSSSSETVITNVIKDRLHYNSSISKSQSGAYKLGTVQVQVPENTGYEDLFEIWGIDLQGDGGSQPGSGYDDSALLDRMSTLEDTIATINELLEDLKNREKEDLEEDIKSIITTGTWFIENIPWGTVFNQQAWSDALDAYFSEVAYVDPDGNTVTWTEVIQSYGSIEQSVKELKALVGEDGKIQNYITALSTLLQTVDENSTAIAELKTKWAISDTNGLLLQWFTSGFESMAGESGSFAQLFSASEGAQAAATTFVNKVEAGANIAARMNEFLSGVDVHATLDSAVATLFASDSDSNSKAAVVATVTGDLSFVDVIADKINLIGDTRIQGYLSGGSASFKGVVNATEFAAGDSGSANMAINGENIEFYFGSECRAYFSQGENNQGMLLHIKNTDGTWYIIDFTNGSWTADGNGWTSQAYYEIDQSTGTLRKKLLYVKDGIWSTEPNSSSSYRVNGTYCAWAESYAIDGTGEQLYGVVADTNNEYKTAAWVKDAARFEMVRFNNGQKTTSSNSIYVGYAPKRLVMSGTTPSMIEYNDARTILIPNGSSTQVDYLYNGYVTEITRFTATVSTPVKNGTFSQLSGQYPEYDADDLGSSLAPQFIPINIDEEDW